MGKKKNKTKERYKNLTLLHSNDLHGDFLAEKINKDLVGGVSMLSGYINKVRNEEQNVIYAISGDMFRGSVIDSEYKGISTIEIMNLLGPDVATIGNHEVDYGIAHLLFIEKCATFPIINANMYIATNGNRLFRPYKIIKINGMKIMFIGLITEMVLARTKLESMIGPFIDINDAVEEVGKVCNAYKPDDVDLTVLLTHIGFEADRVLASKLKPEWGINMIIGGHTHTFLDEPEVVNGIPIVQAGIGTSQIGRFDLIIDTKKNKIASYKWNTIPIKDEYCPRDEELEDLIMTYKYEVDKKYGKIITRLNRQLTHPERRRETEAGNLMADIHKEIAGVDIMFLGSGSLRKQRLGPVVTLGDLTEFYPYDDEIFVAKASGKVIKKFVSNMIRKALDVDTVSEFYQVSYGSEFVWSKSENKLIKAELDGEKIKDDKKYTIGIQRYHLENLEKNLGIKKKDFESEFRCTSTSGFQVVEEYLASHTHLDSVVEGRIKIKE